MRILRFAFAGLCAVLGLGGSAFASSGELIRLSFKEPTSVRDVAKELARQTEMPFTTSVYDGAKIVLTADEPVEFSKMLRLFNAALASTGLTAVRVGCEVAVVSKTQQRFKLAEPKHPLVIPTRPGFESMDFPEGSNLADVLARMATWQDHKVYVLNEIYGGHLHIFAPKTLPVHEAYRLLQLALDQLGEVATEEHGVVTIEAKAQAQSSVDYGDFGELAGPATPVTMPRAWFLEPNVFVEQLTASLGRELSVAPDCELSSTHNFVPKIAVFEAGPLVQRTAFTALRAALATYGCTAADAQGRITVTRLPLR